MCSVAGHRHTTHPAFAFYSATKYAVTALTEGIRVELRQKKSKIRVTVSWWFCVCVGGPVCELVVLCVSLWSCV